MTMPDSLALSTDQAAPTAKVYKQLLLEHAIVPWFPRSIDPIHGGFLTNFDRRWRLVGRQDKMLEAQSRQTLTAAELARAFPDLPALLEATSIGFRFLRDVMWDREQGGWFTLVDRAGTPADREIKHLHGMSYAVQACFAVYAATGDAAALELGEEAFHWIDSHAHDDVDGGYLALLRRDGTPIREGKVNGRSFDHIGTPVGQKDMNVTSDLLEGFGYASAIHPHKVMRQRFDEILKIVIERFAGPGTVPWFYFNPDWSPASTFIRPSTMVQTAARLIELRAFASDPHEIEQAALRLITYAFEHGWNGTLKGLVLSRFADRPMNRDECDNVSWWVQVEALKALEYSLAIDPDFALSKRMKPLVWSALLRNFVDRRFDGFFSLSRARLGLVDRYLPTARRRITLEKGNIWKEANHEARAFLRLAKLFPGSRLISPQARAHTQDQSGRRFLSG
jgi:cellobiose epimerase